MMRHVMAVMLIAAGMLPGCANGNGEPFPLSDNRLVLGQPISDAQYPMVAGLYQCDPEANCRFFCNAVAVAPRVLLTAYHCTVDKPSRFLRVVFDGGTDPNMGLIGQFIPFVGYSVRQRGRDLAAVLLDYAADPYMFANVVSQEEGRDVESSSGSKNVAVVGFSAKGELTTKYGFWNDIAADGDSGKPFVFSRYDRNTDRWQEYSIPNPAQTNELLLSMPVGEPGDSGSPVFDRQERLIGVFNGRHFICGGEPCGYMFDVDSATKTQLFSGIIEIEKQAASSLPCGVIPETGRCDLGVVRRCIGGEVYVENCWQKHTTCEHLGYGYYGCRE